MKNKNQFPHVTTRTGLYHEEQELVYIMKNKIWFIMKNNNWFIS